MPRPIPSIFHIFGEEQSMDRRHTFRERRPCTTAYPGCRRRWGQINLNSVRWGEIFVLGWPEQLRLNKSLLHRHDEPHEPAKEGTLSFVLLESSFTSVSTVSRDHPSLVSLSWNIEIEEFREKTEIVHRSTYTLKKILEREDQYLYVARRTFTNLFLGVTSLNLLRLVPDLTQLSLESIYL